jgi:Transposase domain (DUF772)
MKKVNLACWFCKLGIEDAIPDHSAFSRARNERFREGDVFRHEMTRPSDLLTARPIVDRVLREGRRHPPSEVLKPRLQQPIHDLPNRATYCH